MAKYSVWVSAEVEKEYVVDAESEEEAESKALEEARVDMDGASNIAVDECELLDDDLRAVGGER